MLIQKCPHASPGLLSRWSRLGSFSPRDPPGGEHLIPGCGSPAWGAAGTQMHPARFPCKFKCGLRHPSLLYHGTVSAPEEGPCPASPRGGLFPPAQGEVRQGRRAPSQRGVGGAERRRLPCARLASAPSHSLLPDSASPERLGRARPPSAPRRGCRRGGREAGAGDLPAFRRPNWESNWFQWDKDGDTPPRFSNMSHRAF